MEPPRVSKSGQGKLHLSYHVPHRIHAARIYPITAPNGSTLLIYAHAHGLRVLWRGGRRRKETATSAAPHQTNGINHSEVMVIDDSDDESPAVADEDEWEAEEEELDPDCPYPHILQDLDIAVGGSAVLHLEVPSLHSSATTSSILKKMAIVAIACADGSVQLLQIPLAPPSAASKQGIADEIQRSSIELAARRRPLPTSLAIKFLPALDKHPRMVGSTLQSLADQILVASASRALNIYAVTVKANKLVCIEKFLVRKLSLPFPATGLSFHPSVRSALLLLTDSSGAARVYDIHKIRTPTQPGDLTMTYHTSYHIPKDTPDLDPSLTRRKKILGGQWVLAGKGILVLLEDGEWGIWDMSASQLGNKRVEDFALRGFLGSSSSTEQAELPKTSKKGLSKLAPMTPNTRKTKAEQLFTGAVRAPGVAPRGGISVNPNNPRTGQTDESVAIWYGSEIYSITSTQAFWQRSTSNGGGGFGSLYAPGLSHITDINLSSENITSISQFPVKASAGLGQMNTQRDLFVSAEYRAVVLQSPRMEKSGRSGNMLFQQQIEEQQERPAIEGARDQRMLDAGALDVDGLDRMLDTMAAGQRRVGFAAT